VRIAFGRFGNHDVPVERTDFLERANAIASGASFKVAPAFLAHFGNQFVHPGTDQMNPYPFAELAQFDRFLCVFADPEDGRLASRVKTLRALQDEPGLQILFFPLATRRSELASVKTWLQTNGLRLPFAYPEAAEVHARSLIGAAPDGPTALLTTANGRLLELLSLDEPDFAGRVREGMHASSATASVAGPG
jgi:hypothetical protein